VHRLTNNISDPAVNSGNNAIPPQIIRVTSACRSNNCSKSSPHVRGGGHIGNCVPFRGDMTVAHHRRPIGNRIVTIAGRLPSPAQINQ
jgi:hypothetical protein